MHQYGVHLGQGNEFIIHLVGGKRLTPLAGLTSLTSLDLWLNDIVDLTPLAQLLGLTNLDLESNQIGDLTPLAQFLGLTNLDLRSNQISDLTPLVTNSNKGGLGRRDTVWLEANNLDLTPGSGNLVDIRTLKENGVTVRY